MALHVFSTIPAKYPPPPPYPEGEKPSINEQMGIVIRLALQGDGPLGNKRKSLLMNGDIDGLFLFAKRSSFSCLMHGQDEREVK